MSPLTVGDRLKTVLVATDFSDASEKPLHHALAVARHYRAKLCLAHVVSSLGFTLAGRDTAIAAMELARRDASRLEETLVQSGALTGLSHEFIVVEGSSICEELEEVVRQEQVDLMVIGTHGRRGLGRLLLGSVAEQIFRHADCLVLTVGPGSYPDSPVESSTALRPFLFATDFGADSLCALRYAVSYASHFGARLVLLHVVTRVPVPERFHRPAAEEVMDIRETARTANVRRLEELMSKNSALPVATECIVEFGSPSEQILRAADRLRVDAIIMGLHRSTHIGAASHMPRDTAYEVVCGSSCPVLTVRN
jgi:nucleotide-binding universal stress UspA family protein